MSRCYMYVVARDFGFAPNPFHGFCTLATCKPRIRRRASVGDWVVGMGGRKLAATGRCIYAMRVTETLTFNEYWFDARFSDKRPVRNGSSKMMVGDNIYVTGSDQGAWCQADSHHSHPDGSPNHHNIERDTSADRVLISDHFWYFGRSSPEVPQEILSGMGYENRIGHRNFSGRQADPMLTWLRADFGASINKVMADPYDFDKSEKRYSVHDNRTR